MRFKRITLLLIVALVAGLLGPSLFAQTKEKKRPKLKDFGSSLKRLKWDPIKKRSVERTRGNQASSELDEGDVVRIETNLVTCDVLVVDAQGRLVENLTADDFLIAEDGQPQRVGHFRRGDSASISRSIVLIIDYSGSQFPFLRRSIDAAKVMVDKLAPLDVMAIVTDDVELLLDFTSDKKKLKEKLESLVERTKAGPQIFGLGRHRKFGKSAQYSALMATLNEAFIEDDLRPIIVFQTDGDELYRLQDPLLTQTIPPDLPDDVRAEIEQNRQAAMQRQFENRASFTLADVYRTADKSRATIYTVIPGFRMMNKTSEEQVDLIKKFIESSRAQSMSQMSDKAKKQLKLAEERYRIYSPANLLFRAQQIVVMQTSLAAVAPRTGGWTEFLETPEQADGIYSRILADINSRYILSYYPTNKAHDGARRKIKFEIKGHPEYSVLGRTAYFAPTSP